SHPPGLLVGAEEGARERGSHPRRFSPAAGLFCMPPGGWLFQACFPCLPGSCGAPTRLRFAALSKEDERINFFPVGSNVSYVCRPGYENTSESSPTSTCLENLAWSEAAELCRSEYLCSAPLRWPKSSCGAQSRSGSCSQPTC
uniref:Sushi domain-containing protein n=1 Tax=Bubo bubo TaxID=30461 RepID=A0A8C0EP98_BUBBB